MNIMHNIHLPFPGQRILRSMLAVWACLAVYYARGGNGILFFSVVAALQCIQPYTENMLTMGKKRIIGTIVGTVWGSLVIYLELFIYLKFLDQKNPTGEEFLHFALLGACVGAVLYTAVALKIQESAYFSAVVFLSIAMNHITDLNPAFYITNRVMDTVIGVVVGIFVNSLHFPRLRMNDILFISGIDPILSGATHSMSPYTKVEVNRLIEDGAKFTVITKQAPAMIRDVLEGVKLNHPVIAMDGAVMVDMGSRTFIYAEKMDGSLGREVAAYIQDRGACCFINTIEDNLLVTLYRRMDDGPMKKLFMSRRGSLYRNFVHTEHVNYEGIISFVMIGREEDMRLFAGDLMTQPFSDRIRIDYDTFGCDEGDMIIRVYSAYATRERMIKRLKKELNAERIIKFGIPESCADENLSDSGDKMVKEIKRRFEPVDIHGWKNILKM